MEYKIALCLLFVITASISSNILINVLVNAFGFVDSRDLYRVVQLINSFTEERMYICLFFNVVG